MPRYVILTHDFPTLHWDFLVECGEALKSWRLPETPRAGHCLSAQALDDHRMLYLDYEGPVSGDRGTVVRWDHGQCTWLASDAPDTLRLQLRGHRLRGCVELAVDLSADAIHADQADDQRREVWSFCFHES